MLGSRAPHAPPPSGRWRSRLPERYNRISSIETFGIEQTRRYRDDLEGCFLTIAENPRLGRSAEALSAGLRRIEHRSARRLLSRGRARCSDRSNPALQHGRRTTSCSRAAAIHITPEQGHSPSGMVRIAVGQRPGEPAWQSVQGSARNTPPRWPAGRRLRSPRRRRGLPRRVAETAGLPDPGTRARPAAGHEGAQHLRNGQDRGRSAPKRALMAIGARIGTEHSPAWPTGRRLRSPRRRRGLPGRAAETAGLPDPGTRARPAAPTR